MKKTLLLVLLLAIFFSAEASDTLTLRQIYNFDVGDTFDYKKTSFDIRHQNSFPFDTIYERYVITEIINSPNLDTLIYVRTRLYPSLLEDTIYVSGLVSTILSIDTPMGSSGYSFLSGISNWDSVYNLIINPSILHPYSKYERGLGETVTDTNIHGYDNNGQNVTIYSSVDSLIYSRKGIKKQGTPYYIVSGINDIPSLSRVTVYPNPIQSLLLLSFPDVNEYSPLILLTDLLGQQGVFLTHYR